MSIYRHRRGGWYVAIHLPTERRAQIYLGAVTQAQAETVDRMIQQLRLAYSLGVDPAPDVLTWSRRIDRKLAQKLVSIGMLEAATAQQELTIDQLLESYLRERSDYSPKTLKGWRTAQKHLISAFGGWKISEITPAAAKKYARDLAGKYSADHARKLVERASQLFKHAIDAKITAENPFLGLKIGRKRDKSRAFYLDIATAEAVLAACTHQHARTLFALARFCGLRVPHEVLALRWTDIDWDQARLTIAADTKTGRRLVPLFPIALAELQQLRREVPLDSEHIFDRARASSATTWREWLLAAISGAGLSGWPKLWHNLRASCRTDLEDRFPSHVCDAWLGHSTRVAKDHYLQVTPEHWADARG
jgi:integrase